MRGNFKFGVLGAGAGALLAAVAVFAAYRGMLIPALILVACQAAAPAVFLRIMLRKPSTKANKRDTSLETN